MSKQSESTQTVIDALYDLPLGGNWHDLQTAVCRFWDSSKSDLDQDAIKNLERHFDRAFQYLDRMPQKNQSWRNELYRIPFPACAIDGAGQIVDSNPAGQALLGPANLGAINLPETSQGSIRAAVNLLRMDETKALHLDGESGAPLNLLISRIPKHLSDSGSMYFGVIVTRDLPNHGFKLLAEQYSLTASEIELCLKLAAGRTLNEVAQTSKVKKTTLRTHLSNCFDKLGVSSQPELVAFVLSAMFAGSQLGSAIPTAPVLTPHLDPELHGHPRFHKFELPDGRFIGALEYGDPDGIPALYTHGSFGSGLFMKSQRLHGNGVRLIAVERGGVGESTPNPDPSPQAYAKDILALADHLKLDRFAMIGRSMGSWDAVSVALAAPQRVSLLILAGGRLPVQQPNQHQESPFYTALLRSIWHSDTMGRLMLRMLLLQLVARGPEHFASREQAVGLETAIALDPVYLRHMKANWLRTAEFGAEPLHSHLKLYREPLPDPPWVGLQTPTIVMHGELDPVVPYTRIIEQTASFQYRVVKLLPNVGHRLAQIAMGEVLRTVKSEWPG